jgi:hypothetical protein
MDTGGNSALDPFPRVPQKLTGKGSLAFRDSPFFAASRQITKLGAELNPSSMISAENPTGVITESRR